MSFEQRLIEICDRITARFGWDMEKEAQSWEETGSRRITQTENLRKAVYKAKLEAHNYPLGIVTLHDNIAEDRNSWGASWVNFFGYSKPADFTIEEIEDQRQLALLILDLITLYNDWYRDEFAPIMGSLSPEALKIDPTILMRVNELVNEDHFKCYKYKDAGDTINYSDNFYISTVIGFSSDLTRWLSHVQNQQEFLSNQEPNKVFITLFGKLDEVHPIYSNWLFTLHKGNTIWIVTDKVDFDNPHQKHARLGRRSVWRDRDALTGICDLPYDLFEKIDELRPKNILTKNSHFDRHPFPKFDKKAKEVKLMAEFKRILEENRVDYDTAFATGENSFFGEWEVHELYAKKSGTVVAYAAPGQMIIYKHPEVLFKDFDTIAPGSQVFAKLLCSEIIKHIGSNAETPQIMLAAEHLQQKLIEGAQIDPVKAKHMTYWSKEAKIIFDELIETIDDGKTSSAVTKKSYDVIQAIPTYNASWLSTPDKLASLAEWMVLDKEREALYPKIQKLKDSRDEAWKWLYNLFNANYNTIVSRITSAKDIKFKTKVFGGGFTTKSREEFAGHIFEFFGKGVDAKRGRGIGKTEYREEDCRMCYNDRIQQVRSTTVKRIHIRHYQELMWILGYTDRKQLHKYFRQYRSHTMIPYSGNSILDQTHPYLALEDPCSDSNSNGITIDVFMCKTCYNKITKGKPETLTVTY